jgi:hypothetical protein
LISRRENGSIALRGAAAAAAFDGARRVRVGRFPSAIGGAS